MTPPLLWNAQAAPSDRQRAEISLLLQRGGVVVLPTDTIYGLHAVATNARAVERITQLKGRADEKPFVVLASSLDQLDALGVVFRNDVRATLDDLWPAPLTAILPLRNPIPASRGRQSLAVRIPAVEWLRDLIRETGPLVSTSANRSGEPPVSSPSELPADIADAVDGIVQTHATGNNPSTIIDLSGESPTVIREGDSAFAQKLWKTLRKSL